MWGREALSLGQAYCTKHGGVALSTLSKWICGHPSFFASISPDRELTDRKAAQLKDWLDANPNPPERKKPGRQPRAESAPPIDTASKKVWQRDPKVYTAPPKPVDNMPPIKQKNIGPSPETMVEQHKDITPDIMKEATRRSVPLNVFLAHLAALGWHEYKETIL